MKENPSSPASSALTSSVSRLHTLSRVLHGALILLLIGSCVGCVIGAGLAYTDADFGSSLISLPIPPALIVISSLLFAGCLGLWGLLSVASLTHQLHSLALAASSLAYLALAAVFAAALYHAAHMDTLLLHGWNHAPADVRSAIQTEFACCGWSNYAHFPALAGSCSSLNPAVVGCRDGVQARASWRIRLFLAGMAVVATVLAATIVVHVAYVVVTRDVLALRHELPIELSQVYVASKPGDHKDGSSSSS